MLNFPTTPDSYSFTPSRNLFAGEHFATSFHLRLLLNFLAARAASKKERL